MNAISGIDLKAMGICNVTPTHTKLLLTLILLLQDCKMILILKKDLPTLAKMIN